MSRANVELTTNVISQYLTNVDSSINIPVPNLIEKKKIHVWRKLIIRSLSFDVVYQVNILCKIQWNKQVCDKLKLYIQTSKLTLRLSFGTSTSTM
jgi:hypothetical protein